MSDRTEMHQSSSCPPIALYYLKADGVAEHIERLILGPLKSKSVHVTFRGRRHKKYSNVDADVIDVEGDCPLS